MKRSTILVGAVAVLILLGIAYYYSQMTRNQTGTQQQTQIETQSDEQKVRNVVEDFGRALQNVNLLASDVASQMDESYSSLVTQDLLNSWKDDPRSAPGRLTSSPWPDSIEIATVSKMTDDSYRVDGKIIEVTSADQEGESANTREIALIVNRYDQTWLISDVDMVSESGEGSEKDMLTATSNGVEFQYPRNLSMEYIDTQTWPPTMKTATAQYSCDVTGEEETRNGKTVTQKVVNGRIYCITSENEGAAGTTYTTYTYATPKNGKMLSIDFVLKYPQCANYDEDRSAACTKERQDFDLDAIVDEIAQSAKWDTSGDNSDAVKLQECLPKSDNASKETCDEILGGINDFTECAMAGFTITAGNPNTCALPSGKSFKQS
jgi:hypothetical protein